MAKVVHPMSFDYEVPRTAADLARSRSAKRDGIGERFLISDVVRLIAVVAVCGLLAILIFVAGPIRSISNLVGTAAATSDAASTDAASSNQTQSGNGPTGYFPDGFVVKRWDESPLPPQF